MQTKQKLIPCTKEGDHAENGGHSDRKLEVHLPNPASQQNKGHADKGQETGVEQLRRHLATP